MSFVIAAPEALAAAASDLSGIASVLSDANAATAVRTTRAPLAPLPISGRRGTGGLLIGLDGTAGLV